MRNNRYLLLVDLRLIEAEVLAEEGVSGLALRGAVVVTLGSEVYIFELIACSAEGVHLLQVGVLNRRNALRPILAVRDYAQRTRRKDSGHLGVASAIGCHRDGHTAFAGTPAVEPRREAYHGAEGREAVIHHAQHHRLLTTARSARNAYARHIDIRSRSHVVENRDAVHDLDRTAIGGAVSGRRNLQFGLGIAEEIIIHGNSTHAGKGGHAQLLVTTVATLVEVAHGAENHGINALLGGGVDRTADIEAGKGLQRKVRHRVAVILARFREHRIECHALRQELIHLQLFARLTTNHLGALLKGRTVGVEREEVIHHLLSVGRCVAVVLEGLDAVALLPGLRIGQVEGVEEHREGLVDRVGTNAEVGIGHHQPLGRGIHIEFYIKTLGNLLQHLVQWTGEAILVAVLCLDDQKCTEGE